MPDRGLDLAAIRTEYTLAALDEASVGGDPLSFFHKWFTEANDAQLSEINAMTLATVDEAHKPHARIVLLKGVDTGFVFYTNYNSAKGHDIAANPNAAIVFFWKELERQVRIEGVITKVSEEESDEYFQSRPAGSRLGAWASPQSRVISRLALDENYKIYQSKFKETAITRPEHWGGYRLIADRIEFWQGRSSRMHDRIAFTQSASGWIKQRLAP
ncbi:MAG: pyridoxamine 5'-phosphate oxidase [Flavipsychrobacter sp.]|nr:pyridoxamine 5'-phosphate oxidase [Flavipsychrobacter sp.]